MVGEVVSKSDNDIIWNTPLTRIGYYVGQYMKTKGVKVERKTSHSKQVEHLHRIKERLSNGTTET